MKHLKSLTAVAVAACALGPTAAAQQGLLISEFAVTPTAAEMVEIYNPTGQTIDLSDVYLTDATFQNGNQFYYNIVTGDVGSCCGGGFGDFTARFPDGASIAPGEFQTVALADADGAEGFLASYGVPPTYECLGDGGFDDPAVPDMREGLPGSINGQGGLTNGDEIVILFHWDGLSDLVTDLDYVGYGGNNEQVDKTGVSIDGPDADSDPSTYAADTPIGMQDDAPAPGSGSTSQRISLSEGLETIFGGNGVAGHDETSENVSVTWATGAPTPNGPAAGLGRLLVIPGVQGVNNTLDVTGANPNDIVFLFFALDRALNPVPQCPGLGLGVQLGGGTLLVVRTTDVMGELGFAGTPPDIDVDFYVQAITAGPGAADCKITNLSLVADG